MSQIVAFVQHAVEKAWLLPLLRRRSVDRKTPLDDGDNRDGGTPVVIWQMLDRVVGQCVKSKGVRDVLRASSDVEAQGPAPQGSRNFGGHK